MGSISNLLTGFRPLRQLVSPTGISSRKLDTYLNDKASGGKKTTNKEFHLLVDKKGRQFVSLSTPSWLARKYYGVRQLGSEGRAKFLEDRLAEARILFGDDGAREVVEALKFFTEATTHDMRPTPVFCQHNRALAAARDRVDRLRELANELNGMREKRQLLKGMNPAQLKAEFPKLELAQALARDLNENFAPKAVGSEALIPVNMGTLREHIRSMAGHQNKAPEEVIQSLLLHTAVARDLEPPLFDAICELYTEFRVPYIQGT